MRKRLQGLAVGGSVVLLIATCVLWVRSYWRLDSLMLFRPQRQWRQTWLDRSTITMPAGPVYEADSVAGRIRFLYLYNDSFYERTGFPAYQSMPAAADGTGSSIIWPWNVEAHGGFLWEKEPIWIPVYNGPPGSLAATLVGYAYAIYMPYWFWSAAFLALPAVWVRRSLRLLRRRVAGLCLTCGYDLRATETRCPECGTPAMRPFGTMPK